MYEICKLFKNYDKYANLFVYCGNDPIDYSDKSGYYKYNYTYELGDGWKGIILQKSGAKDTHVKVYRGNELYSQDANGKPTDNSKGSPPKKVKKKLKEKTGWDWDAKEKSYEKKQKEENSSQEFSFNFDFGFSTEDVWTAILYSAILAIFIASFGWLIFIFGGIGAVAIA